MIHPVKPEDYEALAPLWNQVYPNDRFSAQELAYTDALFDEPCKFSRFVALKNGDIVGSSSYAQYAGQYHPQKFVIDVFVHPDHRQQGTGSALYKHLLTQLERFNPISLRVNVHEDESDAVAFAHARGFNETKRDWEAVLDPRCFDPSPYAGLEAKLASKGIQLSSFKAWGVTPEREYAFYTFFNEVRKDVPRSEPATDISYDSFKKSVLAAPDYFPEGVFFALIENRLIGLTMLWQSESTTDLLTGLTAVARDQRRQGVATALKVNALMFAKARGARRVFTDNDTNNTEMIAVNDKLGFRRLPARLSMKKVMTTPL